MKWFTLLPFFILSYLGLDAQASLLDSAYRQQSIPLLDQFLQNWEKEIPPASEAEWSRMNDTMRQAYRVFEAFYRIYDSQDSGRKALKYSIIQNAIEIHFAPQIVFSAEDSLNSYAQHLAKGSEATYNHIRNAKERPSQRLLDDYGPEIHHILVDSISDFRPAMDGSGFNPLYFNPKYKKVIDYFTDSLFYEWPEGIVYNLISMERDRNARIQFLQDRLNYYESRLAITFDARMKYATVRYAGPFGGNEETFENINGKWTFKFLVSRWRY